MSDKNGCMTYDIRMRTPLGIKRGSMTVQRSGHTICGELNILKHSEPFLGIIGDDGECALEGKIVTLIRTFNYRATGKIGNDGLKLLVTDGKNILEITGEPVSET